MKDPLDNKTLDIEEAINNKSQIIGYIRVSSAEQNIDRQLDGLKPDKIFIDKITGSTKNRPELQNMIEYVRHGDTVIVHSLDRLARNLEDLTSIIKTLNKKGVIFKSLKENLTLDGVNNNPMDKLFLHIFGAIAEFNRSLIKEAQREGIVKAKEKGIYKGGRRKALTPQKIATVEKLLEQKNSSVEANKELSYQKIADTVGVSLPTLNRYLAKRQKRK